MENHQNCYIFHIFSSGKGKKLMKSMRIWTYAVHFDRRLPENNPNDSQMDSFLKRIKIFYEEVNYNLTKRHLSHLMVGCIIFLFMGVLKYPHCYHLLHSNSDESKLLPSQCIMKQYWQYPHSSAIIQSYSWWWLFYSNFGYLKASS